MRWCPTRVLPLVVVAASVAAGAAVFLTVLAVNCWRTPW